MLAAVRDWQMDIPCWTLHLPSQVPRPTCQSGNLTITYPTAFYEVKVTKLELGQSLDAILCKVNLSLLLCKSCCAEQDRSPVQEQELVT